MGVFVFFVGVVGGEGEGEGEGSPWGGAPGEEIALGRDREGFLANGDGDDERRTATLQRGEGSSWGGASGEEIALGRDRDGFLANDDGDDER